MAEPGNKSTSKVMREHPGIRMLDYDLKLQFMIKLNGKLDRAVELALVPPSGKASEKQALRESHAEGGWRGEMRLCHDFKTLAHVYTRWGVTAHSNLGEQRCCCR